MSRLYPFLKYWGLDSTKKCDSIGDLRNLLGSRPIGGGVFFVFDENDTDDLRNGIAKLFPCVPESFLPIGRDWPGRMFIDLGHERKVLLLDPCTGEIYEIPYSIEDFFNIVLTEELNAALEYERFNSWKRTGGGLKQGECVGYKIPLVLGGSDDAANQEVCDFKVHWDFLQEITINTRGAWC